MTERDGARLPQWIMNGPSESDGTLGWMAGMCLWWRIQGIALLTLAPIIAGAVVYTQIGAGMAIIAAALVGLFAGEKSMEVSPKYNVTKNF